MEPHALRVVPSHVAWHSPVPPHAGRLPTGGLNAATALQLPAASQRSHCPSHAVVQHTPSAQCPEPQLDSVPDVHALPSGSLHVPSEPETLHFCPEGQLAVPQHTPSTHVSPEAQSLGTWVALHADPAAPVGTQLVPLHLLPALQSALPVHVVLHALPAALHVNGAHPPGAGTLQLPPPLQCPTPTNVPPVHDAVLHATVVSGA